MSLVPRDNWQNFNSLFNSFFPVTKEDEFFSPKVDIHEKEKAFEIIADLPGVDKDNIHVSLENGNLSIEATVASENVEEKEGKVIRKERHSGSYIRNFTVGKNVHESDVQASFNNGVLTLVIPKVEPEQQERRKIEIS